MFDSTFFLCLLCSTSQITLATLLSLEARPVVDFNQINVAVRGLQAHKHLAGPSSVEGAPHGRKL